MLGNNENRHVSRPSNAGGYLFTNILNLVFPMTEMAKSLTEEGKELLIQVPLTSYVVRQM